MKYSIRKIEAADNSAIEKIIKNTMTEFGASGAGFSINDPEVLSMSLFYEKSGHAYFVISDGQNIFGGAGIAPLTGHEDVCELRKMYFLPELRGLGVGQRLIETCLSKARELGFSNCYLETLKSMTRAEKLYLKNCFMPIPEPMGNTGHFSCDSFYLKAL